MNKKVVVFVEDDLYKMKSMLLSIQSILFVAAKQKLSDALGNGDTEVCVLHVLENNEEEGQKIFEGFKATLEEKQREMVNTGTDFKLDYSYKTVHINKRGYPENKEDCFNIISEKIKEITVGRDYSIVLDVILIRPEEKEIKLILDGNQKNLSQSLYLAFSENCIPYTRYDDELQTFREEWSKGAEGRKPFERFCLDGNVIHKKFMKEIYGQLKINVKENA